MSKVFTLFFCALCCIVSFSGDEQLFSFRFYITSIFIQVFSIACIFSNRLRPYSLHKMVYLFFLFFLGIAPIQQYYRQVAFFGARLLTESDYFFTSFLIAIIMLFYQLFYIFFSKLRLGQFSSHLPLKLVVGSHIPFTKGIMLLLLTMFSFLVIFYLNNFSILSMLIRGGELKEHVENVESSTAMLMANQFIRPLSFVCLFYMISVPSKNKVLLFIIAFFAIVTCFPLGMPRFAAAAMYIPLLLLAVPFFRRTNVFSLFFISGFLVLFPFMDSFRMYSTDQNAALGFDMKMFATGHFDSFQSLALMVSENIITWGRQLLGVLLFWVPRSIWQDKPIGSGAMLGEKLNFEWTNISANFFAEGFVNFGYLGIFIFIIILSFFNARTDNIYWRSAVHIKGSFFKVIYYVLLGMIFFILRGDLLSSFAFTVGFLAAVLTIFKLAKSRLL